MAKLTPTHKALRITGLPPCKMDPRERAIFLLGNSSNSHSSRGPLVMVLSGPEAPSPTGDSYQDMGGKARFESSPNGDLSPAHPEWLVSWAQRGGPRKVAGSQGLGDPSDIETVPPRTLLRAHRIQQAHLDRVPGKVGGPAFLQSGTPSTTQGSQTPALSTSSGISQHKECPPRRGIQVVGGTQRAVLSTGAPCSDFLCGPPVTFHAWSPSHPQDGGQSPARGIIRSCSVPGADVSQIQRVSGDVQSFVFTLKALVRYKYTPRLPQCFVTGFDISQYFEAPGLRGACLGTPLHCTHSCTRTFPRLTASLPIGQVGKLGPRGLQSPCPPGLGRPVRAAPLSCEKGQGPSDKALGPPATATAEALSPPSPSPALPRGRCAARNEFHYEISLVSL